MTRAEAAKLLAVLAAYDRRTVGEVDVQVWATAHAETRLTDAIEAVHRHYRTSSEWLDPNRLRQAVQQLRNGRLERFDERDWTPPAEVADDPRRYVDWIRAARAAVADGEQPPVAAVGCRAMPAVEATFKRVPSA